MSPTRIRLRSRAISRNTRASTLDIDDVTLYISYDTVVGVRGPRGAFRAQNTWGPTTSRHIRELGLMNGTKEVYDLDFVLFYLYDIDTGGSVNRDMDQLEVALKLAKMTC